MPGARAGRMLMIVLTVIIVAGMLFGMVAASLVVPT